MANGGGIYQFSRETLDKILDWSPKIIAEQLGVSLSAIYNYRMKIKKAGGVDAVLAKQSAISKYVPKKFTTPNTASNTPEKEEVKISNIDYKEEINFLKELNVLDVLVSTIKEHIPEMVVQGYLNMLCKTIRDEKLFSNPEFFVDIEVRLKNILCTILKTKPIPERVVEVEKKVEVEKIRVIEKKIGSSNNIDRPLDIIYTPERMIREYPQFFITSTLHNFNSSK